MLPQVDITTLGVEVQADRDGLRDCALMALEIIQAQVSAELLADLYDGCSDGSVVEACFPILCQTSERLSQKGVLEDLPGARRSITFRGRRIWFQQFRAVAFPPQLVFCLYPLEYSSVTSMFNRGFLRGLTL